MMTLLTTMTIRKKNLHIHKSCFPFFSCSRIRFLFHAPKKTAVIINLKVWDLWRRTGIFFWPCSSGATFTTASVDDDESRPRVNSRNRWLTPRCIRIESPCMSYTISHHTNLSTSIRFFMFLFFLRDVINRCCKTCLTIGHRSSCIRQL